MSRLMICLPSTRWACQCRSVSSVYLSVKATTVQCWTSCVTWAVSSTAQRTTPYHTTPHHTTPHHASGHRTTRELVKDDQSNGTNDLCHSCHAVCDRDFPPFPITSSTGTGHHWRYCQTLSIQFPIFAFPRNPQPVSHICLTPSILPHQSDPVHSPTSVIHQSDPVLSPTSVIHQSDPVHSPTSVIHQSDPVLSPTSVIHQLDRVRSPTSVRHQSDPVLSPTSVRPHPFFIISQTPSVLPY